MVVLLDPPYREYEVNWKKVNGLLALLTAKLPAGSVVVVESGRTLDARVLPDFDAWDVRRYGGTQVAVREVPAAVRLGPVEEGTVASDDDTDGEQESDDDAGGPSDADA
jgi:hypothetical protein